MTESEAWLVVRHRIATQEDNAICPAVNGLGKLTLLQRGLMLERLWQNRPAGVVDMSRAFWNRDEWVERVKMCDKLSKASAEQPWPQWEQ